MVAFWQWLVATNEEIVMKRTPLLYILHSGKLYGTERMALITAEGLRDRFQTTVFAPPGPVHEEAKRHGFGVEKFSSIWDLFCLLQEYWAKHRNLAIMSTGVWHSLIAWFWNVWYRRRPIHLHLVHGGTDERQSYGRKKWLNRFGIIFVAVSEFVKQRLIANGVTPDKILVIENFLSEQRIAETPKRPPFTSQGVRRLIVVSRIDPIKRVDLLLDALDRTPVLASLQIRVLGAGWDLETLRERAQARNPNVTFTGFLPNALEEMSQADLLVHLCPVEPFGLTILEAMAAGVPVLVPDSGGAGSVVEEGVSGYRFRSNDAGSLAGRLLELTQASPESLNRIVAGGQAALASRFSAQARLADYRLVMEGGN
jgi:glycosyltransferase involved in cell wall biosynthesis